MVDNKLELVAIDYIGNLIPGDFGYRNIFVMVDVFSKFTRLFPTRSYNADNALECIDNFITNQGLMTRILADNASYFQNERFKQSLQERNVQIVFSSIRHPCGNPAERYIGEVIKYIRMKTHQNHADWVRRVHEVEDIINKTPHTVTRECPIFLMTGREPTQLWNTDPDPVPVEEYEGRIDAVRGRLQAAAQRYLERENAKISKQTVFEIGDTVIVKAYNPARRGQGRCAKLFLPFVGPYVITRSFNDVTYELWEMDGRRKKGRYHVSSLYPY